MRVVVRASERDIEELQTTFDEQRDRLLGLGQVLASGVAFVDAEAMAVGQGSGLIIGRSGESAEADAQKRFLAELGVQLAKYVPHEAGPVFDRAAVNAGAGLGVE